MVALTFLGSSGAGNDDFELLSRFELAEGLIGSGEGCWLRVRDPSLVGQHARFLQRDGSWYVGGVAVAAQTRVNGVAIEPGKAVWLDAGDVIEVGDTRLRFGAGADPVEVDLSTRESAMISADRLSERGHPAGERLARGQVELEGWLDEALQHAVDAGLLELTFRFGMIVAARVRAGETPIELRNLLLRLLGSPLAAGLETLSVDVFTWSESLEVARHTCQALVEVGLTSLQSVSLGSVEYLDVRRLGLDWAVLRRRSPRVLDLMACVRFGEARVFVETLGEGRGAALGEHTDLVDRPIELQFGAAEPDDAMPMERALRADTLVVRRTRDRLVAFGEQPITLNGQALRSAWDQALRDGDVLECRGARLRVAFR